MKRTTLLLLTACLVMSVSACQSGVRRQVATPAPAAPAVAAAPAVPDGVTLTEAAEPEPGDEVFIPYRKYRLDNGLTLILHEDASDPLVHVDLTYHVGSAREEVGKSGFAHFFEHMMFQGSTNVGDDQHFRIVSESGGRLNGTTNNDRTNYFQTAPANQLEKLLWLEADRMGFLLDAVTQEKFEVQRDTVKNERGQRVDNAPYGLMGERVGEALYPRGASVLVVGDRLRRGPRPGRRGRPEGVLPALVRAQQRRPDHRRRLRRGRDPRLGRQVLRLDPAGPRRRHAGQAGRHPRRRPLHLARGQRRAAADADRPSPPSTASTPTRRLSTC